MFHWICPECGRDISPAVKECPACDPKAASVAASPEAVAPPPLPTVAARPKPVVNPVINHVPSPPLSPLISPELNAEPPVDILLMMAESIRAAQRPVPKPEAPAVRKTEAVKSEVKTEAAKPAVLKAEPEAVMPRSITAEAAKGRGS